MESKPKVCCANCLKQCFCQMCSNPDTGYCTDFEGPGLTPQMEMEELTEENRRLREAYDTASGYVRASKYNILESKKERYWRAVEILKECRQIIKFGKVLKK